jgi:glyoxylase-like metal-dependent hydrolase (beta-lactamase superfamily II)
MYRSLVAVAVFCLSIVLAVPPSTAQTPATPPLFATTKVDGTDNVYIFRYQNHQAMFVVTPAGVIATDPISYGRPQAAKTYIDEIRKITKAPIRYLIYSHHHDDHIAGGNLFKKEGAIVIAHRRAYERLFQRRNADVTLPDQIVDGQRSIYLGGTRLDLVYTGRNHSDSTLVMFLPKEKVIFAVDFNSLGAIPSRLAVNDSYPEEWQASLKRTLGLAWEKMIPGHPGPGGRLGTRKDMEDQLAFFTELSAEVKKMSDQGKCFDPATKEVRLPKFGTLAGYEQNIEWVIHRWCGYWGRGI